MNLFRIFHAFHICSWTFAGATRFRVYQFVLLSLLNDHLLIIISSWGAYLPIFLVLFLTTNRSVRRKSLTPEFLWAQRKDQIYLTVNIPNVKKEAAKVSMKDDGKVSFSGTGGVLGKEQSYSLEISLFKGIKAEESKCKISPRNIVFRIKKAESGPYWDRLLLEEGRNIHCKIDWQNWIDEDEDENLGASMFGESKDHEEMDFTADGSSSEEDAAVNGATETQL